jgi:serine protease AprX
MRESEVFEILYGRSGSPESGPGPVRGRRFTQDTPIMPEVWIAFGAAGPEKTQKLLLTPNSASDISALVSALRHALAAVRGVDPKSVFLAYNESHVAVDLTFRETALAALPLSAWWSRRVEGDRLAENLLDLRQSEDAARILRDPARYPQQAGLQPDVLDMVRLVGAIALGGETQLEDDGYWREALDAATALFAKLPAPQPAKVAPLWSVFLCRQAEGAIMQSRISIKADAATRVFDLSCKEVAWAVIDSGIDAAHPAFTDWSRHGGSRVEACFDFTRIEAIQKAAFTGDLASLRKLAPGVPEKELEGAGSELQQRLLSGRLLDWCVLQPLLEMRPGDNGAVPAPVNEHGTHVAGILAANWRKLKSGERRDGYCPPPEKEVVGVCPDLRLYDLRVIGDDGRGDEFAVLSALQFVRRLNMGRDRMAIHGVNLSFSLPQKVSSFACGSSPVCVECDRLVDSGVVVVAAAGNRGYIAGQDGFECFRNISITDPGNSDAVITVGSTHRSEPHRYGVSYFSSRGPTGDGRSKPDLVAPGEKILSLSPSLGPLLALDGTSMAAPHVSGAAALLMARYRELIGRPRRIKEILCSTATDLGRERAFQGAGMLDVLRAMESV